jgi:hypothetical protein
MAGGTSIKGGSITPGIPYYMQLVTSSPENEEDIT